MFCNICGENRDAEKFFPGPEPHTIRFKGGSLASIKIKPIAGEMCRRCLALMQSLLAESKALYPDKMTEALKKQKEDG